MNTPCSSNSANVLSFERGGGSWNILRSKVTAIDLLYNEIDICHALVPSSVVVTAMHDSDSILCECVSSSVCCGFVFCKVARITTIAGVASFLGLVTLLLAHSGACLQGKISRMREYYCVP